MARASHTGPREWDAEVYDQVAQPQFEWSREVLDRLGLRGDETVLDAGCGSGRVTAALIERLPRGRVIAVDGSESMVRMARRRLGNEAEVHHADLVEVELGEQVDAIFSNAVFHWLIDHDQLFGKLYGLLRRGGRLVAQCGGEGNVASLTRAIAIVSAEDEFQSHFDSMPRAWNFASAGQTDERLRGAGFTAVGCSLEPKPVRPDRPLEYLATATLGPHLDRLPESLRDRFVARVADQLGSPIVLDYVRLNIEARRPL